MQKVIDLLAQLSSSHARNFTALFSSPTKSTIYDAFVTPCSLGIPEYRFSSILALPGFKRDRIDLSSVSIEKDKYRRSPHKHMRPLSKLPPRSLRNPNAVNNSASIRFQIEVPVKPSL